MSSLKYMILLVTIFIVTTTALHSKSYNSWHLLYSDTYGVIKKIKDPKKKVTVVEFKSKSSRDTYINGAKTGEKSWNNKKDKIIKWDFNFNKNFVIMVSIKTKKGYRDLIYTSGEDNGNLYFGLGKYLISGTWQTITRDLEADLHKHEPNNEIVSVNAFIIRGSGKIGKIEMFSSKKKKILSKDEKSLNDAKVEKIVKTVEEKIKDIIRKEQEIRQENQSKIEKQVKIDIKDENSFTPKIILEQGNLIYHKLGEPFFEPGATATDYNGETIDVDVIGEVDINKVNRYVLSYIATDDNGYTTTKSRVVMVHKAGAEVKEKREPKPKVKSEKNLEQERMEKYEELMPLSPLDNPNNMSMEIDEDLLYYD